MKAKIIEIEGIKKIKWVEETDQVLTFRDYINFECINPKDADDSLGRLYDEMREEICKKWSVEENVIDKKVFGFEPEVFTDALKHYKQSKFSEFPIFMNDLSYYVSNNVYCITRYDVFVAFIKEFATILQE
ncbi:MAG: hypothetical protein PWR23_894 [Peptostreptococcaceae bacterium]|jgi:hypothetical protein|nr:hypothetical protein [Peptostreptococcaceae bacterium]